MFDSSNIIVGLEIGTSKVCAVVGEMSAEGALNIVGLGQSKSRAAQWISWIWAGVSSSLACWRSKRGPLT